MKGRRREETLVNRDEAVQVSIVFLEIMQILDLIVTDIVYNVLGSTILG
jgi:hypothetical protein